MNMSHKEIAKNICLEMIKDETEMFREVFRRVATNLKIGNSTVRLVWNEMKSDPSLLYTNNFSEREKILLKNRLTKFVYTSNRKPRNHKNSTKWSLNNDMEIINGFIESKKANLTDVLNDLAKQTGRSKVAIKQRYYNHIKPNIYSFNLTEEDLKQVLRYSNKTKVYKETINLGENYDEVRKQKFLANKILKITLIDLARNKDTAKNIIDNIANIIGTSKYRIIKDLKDNLNILDYLFDLYNIEKENIEDVRSKILSLKYNNVSNLENSNNKERENINMAKKNTKEEIVKNNEIIYDPNADYVFRKIDEDNYEVIKIVNPIYSKEKVLSLLQSNKSKTQVLDSDNNIIAKNYLD